ncbi:MAG: hypothetical protein A2958_02745 [Candidatus Levybacteria bacterium RIFCSPLOWO2_01_FULL_38_13]|nr:MAG: hypothetical protein A2629_03160 [Candidatus Levybacteria bacterium RIFCSPHIGHO2_01_FULL_41_15]OGH35255.1 MAG: hypothetical protein A2958_02745 [Candidatus Levybacteria bacterium RIFCSPLOWO2_01_FULL_38_13]
MRINFKFHPFGKLRARISRRRHSLWRRTANFKLLRGFTLVELLIVIAIVGVLSTLVIANFAEVRKRARDSQRKSDVRQIQSAIELIRSDTGSYPGSLPSCGSSLTAGSPATTYMQKVPCDPSGATYWNGGIYYYLPSGSTYTLASCMENAQESGSDIQETSPGGSGTCSSGKWYVLTSP